MTFRLRSVPMADPKLASKRSNSSHMNEHLGATHFEFHSFQWPPSSIPAHTHRTLPRLTLPTSTTHILSPTLIRVPTPLQSRQPPTPSRTPRRRPLPSQAPLDSTFQVPSPAKRSIPPRGHPSQSKDKTPRKGAERNPYPSQRFLSTCVRSCFFVARRR